MASNGDHGKRFERELKESMEACGAMVHRIPDVQLFNGRTMMGVKTPADFYAWLMTPVGLFSIIIEAKATALTNLSFDRVQPHQMASMAQFCTYAPHMVAYVAIDFWRKSGPISQRNTCFMVPYGVFEEYMSKGERKSLPLDACIKDDRIVLCPRGSGRYDMAPWAESIWRQ